MYDLARAINTAIRIKESIRPIRMGNPRSFVFGPPAGGLAVEINRRGIDVGCCVVIIRTIGHEHFWRHGVFALEKGLGETNVTI